VEQALDMNELLVKHPAATFFVRAAGDSMVQAGIIPGMIKSS
jgi:DNA polymerase V